MMPVETTATAATNPRFPMLLWSAMDIYKKLVLPRSVLPLFPTLGGETTEVANIYVVMKNDGGEDDDEGG